MTPMLKPPTKLLKNGTHQFTRSVYKVWWYGGPHGVVEKYVVADNNEMAKRKAKLKWRKDTVGLQFGAKLLFKKGHVTGFYGSPNVDLR